MSWFKSENAKINDDRVYLPVGLTGFHAWCERIIALAGMPASVESQKSTLAHMITNLPPGEDSVSESAIVKNLRRAAANQVAIYYREKIYPEVKARLAREEAQAQQGEATPPVSVDGKVVALKADRGANPDLGTKA